MFDLILSSFSFEAGQDRKELPGLYAAIPQKISRIRAGDRLIMLLGQTGSVSLAPNLQQEVLARLAETYYASTGSVTAGMKAVAERLNDFLINRNLRLSRQQGGQTIGVLNMAVVRGSTVSIAHAGLTHTYLLGAGKVEHFNDASGIGRPLGLAKSVSLRYFQAALEPEAGLLLSSDAPSGWSDAALTAAYSAPGNRLARLADGVLDLQAGFVRLKPGKGEVRFEAIVFPARAAEPASKPAVERAAPRTPEPIKPVEPVVEPPAETAPLGGIFLSGKPLAESDPDRAPWDEPAQPAALASPARRPEAPQPASSPAQSADVRPRPTRPASAPAQPSTARQEPTAAPTPAPQPAPERPRRSAAAAGSAHALTGLIAGIRGGLRALNDGVSRLVARALPDQPSEGMRVSASTMLFIALAVPVVVSAVAVTVYAQRGRGELQQAQIQAAHQYFDQSAAHEELDLRRSDWKQALGYLDKADSYGESQDSLDLRAQIQSQMDLLDSVKRLTYRPALNTTLGETVAVGRMVASVNDVYLLDSSQGRILRLYRSGTAYELDVSFLCGPINAGSITVGKLVDIAMLPPDNIARATVMGIDGGGNVLLCGLNNEIPAAVALTAPDSSWGNLSRAVFFQGNLYVLDAQYNQIVRYGYEQGNLDSVPHQYFDSQVPHLGDVIDLAVDQEYLYLLHADGSMTTCAAAGATIGCDDPSPYGDERAGYDSAPIQFDGSQFVMLQATQPPDPSLYVLDSKNAAVYHLSLRKLNLQDQLHPEVRSDYPTQGKPATAFVITPSRRLVLAVGNQVFFALLP